MAEDLVTIGFRGTSEYRRKLQREALERGLKVQNMIEEAVEFYLASRHGESKDGVKMPSPLGDLTPEEHRWVTALLAYLRDESKPYKENVLGMLAAAMGVDIPAPKSRRRTG